MERTCTALTWRRWIFTGMLVCLLYLYFPWGQLLHASPSVTVYTGWALAGLALLLIAFGRRLSLRSSLQVFAGIVLLTLPVLWMPEQADHWRVLCRVMAMLAGALLLARMAGTGLRPGQAAALERNQSWTSAAEAWMSALELATGGNARWCRDRHAWCIARSRKACR